MSIIEKITDNVLNRGFESIDGPTIRIIKNKIIDVIGCIFAGAKAPGCQECVSLVKRWGGKGESTIIGYGSKAPAQNAALANVVMARSYDYEPVEAYYNDSHVPAHISATIVPTAIAIAEDRHTDGKELIASIILAEDFTSRLTVASNYSLESGWDSTGTTNVFGATAAASRLYGLDKKQTLNAFGIALNQLGGTLQSFFDNSHSFKLPQGMAAWAGIFSAELAAEGFTGVQDALTSRYGYFNIYCQSSRPDILIHELGSKFQINSVFKAYPCCRINHASIDCALDIVKKNQFSYEDIADITIYVAPQVQSSFISQPFKGGENPQISAAFNLRFNVANALMRNSVKLEHFTDEYIRDPRLKELTEKVKLISTEPSVNILAARLVVRLTDGREISALVEYPRGDPYYNPLSEDDIIEKFWENVTFSNMIPEKNAKRVLELIQNLEDVADLGEIAALLAKN